MDEVQRFTKISEEITNLSSLKIRYEERLKAEKEKLENLLKEITAKGYDPSKLSENREQKQKELKIKMDDLEAKVKDVRIKLQAIEQSAI